MTDKAAPSNELCSQGCNKSHNSFTTGGTERRSSMLNDNPMTVEASGVRDAVGRVVGTLNDYEMGIREASPSFVGEVLDDLGLDNAPILVGAGILVAFYVLYKLS